MNLSQQLIKTVHEAYCTKNYIAWLAWHKRWPDACTSCEGAGYHHFAGTFFEPPQDDPCSCIEEGKCPRCSKLIRFYPQDEYTDHCKCEHCGWDESLYYTWSKLTEEQKTIYNEMFAPSHECYCYPIGVNPREEL